MEVEKKLSHSLSNGRIADGPTSTDCTSAIKGSPAPRKRQPTIIVKQPTMESFEELKQHPVLRDEAADHQALKSYHTQGSVDDLQQQKKQQRRKTLFDMPVQNDVQFECLTGSALNQGKQKTKNMKQSVLVQGLADFNFNKYV